ILFGTLVAALLVTNRRLAPRKATLSRATAEAGTVLRGRIVDMFGNVAAVRQYVRRNHEHGEIRALAQELREKDRASWTYTEMMLLLNGAVLFVFALGMFWSLTYQWSIGNVTAGDFVLILSLVSQITGTLLFIGRSFNATARALGEVRE